MSQDSALIDFSGGSGMIGFASSMTGDSLARAIAPIISGDAIKEMKKTVESTADSESSVVLPEETAVDEILERLIRRIEDLETQQEADAKRIAALEQGVADLEKSGGITDEAKKLLLGEFNNEMNSMSSELLKRTTTVSRRVDKAEERLTTVEEKLRGVGLRKEKDDPSVENQAGDEGLFSDRSISPDGEAEHLMVQKEDTQGQPRVVLPGARHRVDDDSRKTREKREAGGSRTRRGERLPPVGTEFVTMTPSSDKKEDKKESLRARLAAKASQKRVRVSLDDF